MEPTRLLNEGATELERWILETAQSERPSADLDALMLSALGSVPLLDGSGTEHAPGTEPVSGTQVRPPAPEPSSPAHPVVGRVGWGELSLAKWGAGIVGIAGVALTWFLLGSGAPGGGAQATATVRSATPSTAPEERSAQIAAPAAVDVAGPSENAEQNAPAEPVRGHEGAYRASAAKTASDPAPSDPLKDELALLERARKALDRGQPDAALALLGQYTRRHPHGQLSQEATVLRVQALEARGKGAQANQLAADFLEKNPTSAHAPQIERAHTAP